MHGAHPEVDVRSVELALSKTESFDPRGDQRGPSAEGSHASGQWGQGSGASAAVQRASGQSPMVPAAHEGKEDMAARGDCETAPAAPSISSSVVVDAAGWV